MFLDKNNTGIQHYLYTVAFHHSDKLTRYAHEGYDCRCLHELVAAKMPAAIHLLRQELDAIINVPYPPRNLTATWSPLTFCDLIYHPICSPALPPTALKLRRSETSASTNVYVLIIWLCLLLPQATGSTRTSHATPGRDYAVVATVRLQCHRRQTLPTLDRALARSDPAQLTTQPGCRISACRNTPAAMLQLAASAAGRACPCPQHHNLPLRTQQQAPHPHQAQALPPTSPTHLRHQPSSSRRRSSREDNSRRQARRTQLRDPAGQPAGRPAYAARAPRASPGWPTS